MFCASPVNVGWAWSSDCFGRLSPNLCCLFQALLIVMCSIAVYLQRKHDLTWLAVCVQSQGERYASVNKRLYSFLRKRVRFNQFTSISPRIGVWKLFDLRQACDAMAFCAATRSATRTVVVRISSVLYIQVVLSIRSEFLRFYSTCFIRNHMFTQLEVTLVTFILR